MEFRILGPLEVVERDHLTALPGGKPQALLAVLLLHPNEVVPTARLVDELWDGSPPAAATKNLQLYVSLLRKALGSGADGILSTRAGGYVLEIADGQLDAQRFERLLADGRAALHRGEPGRAAEILREALALWRGRALVDFSYEPFAQRESARLEELHVAAVEQRIEADLAVGSHAEVVPELETLVAEHPYRERLRGQLMLALYRSGRQADALEVFRQGRDRLVDDLGLEPGPALKRLEQEILLQSVDVMPPGTGRPSRHRLPSPPNPTIGRRRELGEVVARLREPSVRLVTLLGPGGTGKTRLALEVAGTVADEFANGAQLVSLSGTARWEDVPTAMVAALGIVPAATESSEEALQRYLLSKQLLLVIDNCEHLRGTGAFIGELLACCSELTVLATSRQPLALQAEYRYPVPPLELPPPGATEESLGTVAAVALFVERAQAQDPAFRLTAATASAVADICRRVDGLPLAIELAAARCGVLSVPELSQRLDAALAAPGAAPQDAPARQRTLRATIDWSYALLDDEEKRALARFAVFAGGASLDGAETVAHARFEVLDRLVTKSLLTRHLEPPAGTRLAMLETIRAYAADELATRADRDEVHESHCRYFLALAEREGTEQALCGMASGEHLRALDAERDNFDAALRWAAEHEPGLALALVVALGQYWLLRSRYAQGAAWFRRALDLPGTEHLPALRARALLRLHWFLWPLGRGAERAALAAEAVALASEADDPVVLSRALRARAHTEHRSGRPEAAAALAEQAVACSVRAGDEWEIALAHWEHANVAPTMTDLIPRVERAERFLLAAGNVQMLCALLSNAGYAAMIEGCDREAMAYLQRAAAIDRKRDDPYGSMIISGNLGLAALFLGELSVARDAFERELRLCHELGTVRVAQEALCGLAGIAAVEGNDLRAACLLGAAEAHRYGEPEDTVDARVRVTFLDPARTRTEADAWQHAVRRGRGLSFDDAVAFASKASVRRDLVPTTR